MSRLNSRERERERKNGLEMGVRNMVIVMMAYQLVLEPVEPEPELVVAVESIESVDLPIVLFL